MGADVVRIDRPAKVAANTYEQQRTAADPRKSVLDRGRRSVVVDLKQPAGVDLVLRLVEVADVLVEGYRPGVMERLGLGPQPCRTRNQRLVYGRLTGWGQHGPLAQTAGHDITYIAVAGALRNVARHGAAPVPPLSLVGDMGGGGMLLALGVVAALLEARASGHGQVVDAAMVDGVAGLLTMYYGLLAQDRWRDEPGRNFGDTGAPYYDVYETADGKYLAVGSLEYEFYAQMLDRMAIDPASLPSRDDEEQWPALRARLAAAFSERTRAAWEKAFEGSDACVAPVLSLGEAPGHPHLVARSTYVEREGVVQPAPAPRFSRTPSQLPGVAPVRGEGAEEALGGWGIPADEINRWRSVGALRY
jgi:alpha-methylacyl-CoA racemase